MNVPSPSRDQPCTTTGLHPSGQIHLAAWHTLQPCNHHVCARQLWASPSCPMCKECIVDLRHPSLQSRTWDWQSEEPLSRDTTNLAPAPLSLPAPFA